MTSLNEINDKLDELEYIIATIKMGYLDSFDIKLFNRFKNCTDDLKFMMWDYLKDIKTEKFI